MDKKVIAAFAVFILSLLLWAVLVVINRPELSGIVTFVQTVCGSAWTAVALFIDTKQVSLSQPQAEATQPTAMASTINQ
jgi:hypothetical protein